MAVEPEKHEDGLDKDGGEAGEVSSVICQQLFKVLIL